MNNKKNAISSLALQLATIAQGLILPKLILGAFGSEVNGLVSSITQFLSFISLLEGGLGAVVLAELYGPIEKKNDDKIQGILGACQSFFSKLTLVFLVYTILVAFFYPRYIDTSLSKEAVSALVLILSMTTVAQYLFSITYRLLLQAEQKLYIVNYVSAVTILINTISAAVIIFVFPSIHVVKLCSGIIYMIQPMVYKAFVEKKFLKENIRKKKQHYILKNRWSGFAQNLAHFVNMNTDVALITLFMPLQYVSVYSVHLLVINALRGIVTSVGNSYQSALGKYIAMGDSAQLKQKFRKFEEGFWLTGMVLFFCCALLINPFIQIYTTGITDAEYYQPIFSFVIVLANMIYVIREPYRLLVLAGGKFKETNFGAFAEAIINLGMSLLLITKFGLIGVAIGTLVAIVFRLIYLVWYLRKDIIQLGYASFSPYIVTFIVVFAVNLFVYISWPLKLNGIIRFFVAGCIVFVAECGVCGLVYWINRRIFQATKG
ncbi:MAG: hypothetical protein PUC12_09570 [Clostridiales bacterium]|nr:hypothetical protein [Clostridiales bacterium]